MTNSQRIKATKTKNIKPKYRQWYWAFLAMWWILLGNKGKCYAISTLLKIAWLKWYLLYVTRQLYDVDLLKMKLESLISSGKLPWKLGDGTGFINTSICHFFSQYFIRSFNCLSCFIILRGHISKSLPMLLNGKDTKRGITTDRKDFVIIFN